MCRYFAYRGEPAPLSKWVFDASRSLERQAYQPLELVSGTINVDGTGVGWWNQGESAPLRYVFDGPPWADPNLSTLAPRIVSGTQVAVVRSATPGIGHGPGHLQPFTHDAAGVAVAHNGWVGGFRGPLGQQMLADLDSDRFAELPAMNDSAVIFSAIVQQILGGATTDSALRTVTEKVLELGRSHGQAVTLSIAVSDADQIAAIRTATGVRPNSLYMCARDEGHLLASEPLDDGVWEPTPIDHLVVMTTRGHHVTPL